MRRAGICLALGGLLATGTPVALCSAGAAEPSPAPDFQEVHSLIREHLAGLTPAELDRTAVEALVNALAPRVSLVGGDEQDRHEPGGPLVAKASLFEGSIAYLRVARVEDGLAEAVREAYRQVGTNHSNGVVLDLRFAGGKDYAAAGNTADLFLKTEKALLDWGTGSLRSKEKADAISPPVAVLVNGETTRAAEALAAVLRETGAGLIIGGRTAGQAMIAEEYPLRNGQRLRIATAPIKVGQATALSPQGLQPDLRVNTNPEEERAYLADPFKEVAAAVSTNNAGILGTNRIRRPRFSEAELVRERREGLPLELDASSQAEEEPEKPVVRDPALARALDVLKGLAVVRQSRS